MNKVAIITTHPIQYNAPFFKLLNEQKEIKFKVFYTLSQSQKTIFDERFSKEIKWDIPLLEGYDFCFVKNISSAPGSAKYKGIINPTLIEEVEAWNAESIIVFGWNHHSHFKAMRYFKGKIPIYFRGDSTLLDEKKNIKTLLRRISLKIVYRYVDYAFYVGKNNKEYYKKHGLKGKQLMYAPHAIENERFSDKKGDYEKDAQKWRKKLNLNEKDKVFLFVGKFENKKNPLFLIDLAKKLIDYKFLFVGSGALEKEMKEKAENLNNVSFLPFQNQTMMPVVYRLGNVFVLPSVGPGETWGLVVNEALACDVPVIVSDKVGCFPDMVKEGETGVVFEANNEDDFICKSQYLLNHLDSVREKTGSKIFINRFSYSVLKEKIIIGLKQSR